MIEVVKYGPKFFSDPTLKKKEKSKGNEKIYVAGLNNIYNAMRGMRIFERFGFNLPEGNKYNSPGAFVAEDFQEWNFDTNKFKWTDGAGNKLSDFQPTAQLLDILENKIDLDLE